jgi:hypothetical protein
MQKGVTDVIEIQSSDEGFSSESEEQSEIKSSARKLTLQSKQSNKEPG